MRATPLATALACLAAPLQAAEPLSATVGGYIEGGVSLSDRQDGVGVLRDGEVHFSIEGTADNGLVFGARVELEATTSSDQIDENFVFVRGRFGTLQIGGDDDAKDALLSGIARFAPVSDQIGYYDDNDVSRLGVGGIDSVGDDIGVHWTSPRLSGVQVRLGWQPDGMSDGAGDRGVAVFDRPGPLSGGPAWSAAATFVESFGEVGVGLGAGWILIDDGSDTDSVGVAAGVAWRGLGLRAYWEDNFTDSEDVAIGAQYRAGPWTVAGGWSVGGRPLVKDTETVGAWVAYALAPGIVTTIGVEHADGALGNATQGTAWINIAF